MLKPFLTILVLLVAIITVATFRSNTLIPDETIAQRLNQEIQTSATPTSIPPQKDLRNDYHIYQSFNNCGPASLSMALSHYNIRASQEELGTELRPWQNLAGDNDDKSVTLEEMGKKAKDYNLIPYHRPDGDIELLTRLIALDLPVITRTWLTADEDIGHYRVVTGYDITKREIVQDDSYQGPNLTYSYDDFNELWSKFSYEYLVLVPEEKKEQVEEILGDEVDEKIAWQHAKENAERTLAENAEEVTSRFNLSVAEYHLGHFQESVDHYESVKDQLPFRTLWYQTEPIQAYYELGDYDQVFSITDAILNNHNRAYSEVYIIRGDSYKKLNNVKAATSEYEKALYYNQNLQLVQDRLSAL